MTHHAQKVSHSMIEMPSESAAARRQASLQDPHGAGSTYPVTLVTFYYFVPLRETCWQTHMQVSWSLSSRCSHSARLPSLAQQQNTWLMCFPGWFSAPRPFQSSLVSPLQRKRRPNCPCQDVYPSQLLPAPATKPHSLTEKKQRLPVPVCGMQLTVSTVAATDLQAQTQLCSQVLFFKKIF